MVVKTIEELKKQVWENSLHTCEYISGEPRLGTKIHIRCIIHNEEFDIGYEIIRRDDRKHHFCQKCQLEDKQKDMVKFECEFCGKKSMMSKSKFARANYHFCSRQCKDLAQRLGSGDKFSGLHPTPGKQSHYRMTAFNAYLHKCAVCGWDEDEDVLDVHHIDEDRSNNSVDNLIILCPNCHKKLSTHKYYLQGNKILKK